MLSKVADHWSGAGQITPPAAEDLLKPEAGSPLPINEHDDSEDKQDHAHGEPQPRTPFIIAFLPTSHSGADAPRPGPIQIGHVEQQDGETGYQARQSAKRVVPPDQQHRCEASCWSRWPDEGVFEVSRDRVAGRLLFAFGFWLPLLLPGAVGRGCRRRGRAVAGWPGS